MGHTLAKCQIWATFSCIGNISIDALKHTQIKICGKFGVYVTFGRIYDSKQKVMKPREIFTVSVRAYYPQDEDQVLET